MRKFLLVNCCIASLLMWSTIRVVAEHDSAVKLPTPSGRKVDFVKDIQPIFSERCYSCHGPNKHEAQFRLDAKEIVLKGGELGPAILPGKSAESLLIQAVAGLKDDLKMPRKGEPLTTEQIGLLRAWIDQGADWPDSASVKIIDPRDHWAFKTPVRPKVPEVKQKAWVRNPIDNFILARLEKENIKPSAEADRHMLIRRLTLDLTGLPPTITEIKNYVASRDPRAYEVLLEKLLASKHYGERWGRHWLDLARYADTNGYEKDKPRSIWPYRDWVIKVLNDDMPFDEFVTEQLAGDLLPNATLDQKIATGFLRNSMLNQEGGIEPEQFRVEALVDRMDTIGKSLLGLTINCCQCHNHKFDPFAQKEYYQLYAFLNNDDEAFVEVPTAEQKKARKEVLQKIRELEDKEMKNATNLSQRIADWVKQLPEPTTNWQVLEPKDWQNFATKFEKEEDNSLLGGGDLQPGGVMRVWADTQLTNITGFRLEALTNANLMYNGPGLLGRGVFQLKEFTVEAYAVNNPTVTNKIKFRRAVADVSAPGMSITNAIDGDEKKGGWTPCAHPDHANEYHVAMFECDQPFGFPGGTRLAISMDEKFDKDSGLAAHMLGCFRLSVTTNAGSLAVDMLNRNQHNALGVPEGKRTQTEQLALFDAYHRANGTFTNLDREIDVAFKDWPYPPTSMVLQKRATPRVTHIFKRGDRLRPLNEVQPAVLSVLNPLPKDAPLNRLGLAKWIVDKRSPTTARAFVNRVWQEYFGQGLVSTPEDFGTRVDTPSHLELLDWLACEFMDSGWDIKKLHRLIVSSATYRQSSKVSPELYAKDQFNRLLARSPRLRVEGEVVQDIALSVSGLLNQNVGGPSVYPAIPANVGDTAYGGFSWPESKGSDRYRRGMYTFSKRSLPFPSLSAFDTPSGEVSCPRRVRSNTPLQALTTLNEKTFVEAAQALAERVMKEGGTNDTSRAAYAFELCTGRKPDQIEMDKLLKFWKEQFDYFEDRTAAAVSVSLGNKKKLPEDISLHKAAAWTMVSRAILNLDETITRE